MAKHGLGALPWLFDRQLGQPGSIAGAEAHSRAFDAVIAGPVVAPRPPRAVPAIDVALEHLAANPDALAIVVFGRYDQARKALAGAGEVATADQLRRLLCTIAFDFETATSGHSCPVFVDSTAAHLRGFPEKLQRYRDRSGQ
jgi:hypothetical protein